MQTATHPLTRAIVAAAFWIAAFSLSVATFLSATKLLRRIPPPDPIAVGRVTIDAVSKPREYAAALLFYILVPLLTLALEPLLRRLHRRLSGGSADLLSSALFTIPQFFAPILFLTTRKEQWGLLLPLLIGCGGALAARLIGTRLWLRSLLARDMGVFHALLMAEAVAWLLFRLLATGKRLAHISTLFLEIPFLAFFLVLFLAAAILVSQIGSLASGRSAKGSFARFTLGAAPLLLLPFLALMPGDPAKGAVVIWAISLALIVILVATTRADPAPATVSATRRLLAWAAIPALLFVMSWCSYAHLSDWVDLFHRGESLGPASDYLRGKVPYLDVFVLHGLLDDGLLDAWLMELFGRSVEVHDTRILAATGLAMVAVWVLGYALFESIPMAIVLVALTLVTSLENTRALFEILVAAVLFMGLARGRRLVIAASGALAGVALFYSLDTGIYAVVGSLLAVVAAAVWSRRAGQGPTGVAGNLGALTAGMIAGAAPFLAWLAARGALGAFLQGSLIDVPRFIDPVWSTPFPDDIPFFLNDLSARSMTTFLLSERARFYLNPLVLGVASVVLVAWFARRRWDRTTLALLVLTLFAGLTQRSALGRADFSHQHFAAFLIGAILLLLFQIAARALAAIRAGSGTGSRIAIATFAALLVPLVGTVLWTPDLLDLRMQTLAGYRARREGLVPDPNAVDQKKRIEALTTAIRERVPEDSPIFDFSNQPALYFFADRPNPTRFYQIPILSPPRFQMEALRDLEATRPEVVLRHSPEGYDRFDGVPNELRAQALSAYIDDRYRLDRTVHGIEIWTRRSVPSPASIDSFMRRIHLPPPGELTPRVRVVFGSVGSATGAAGSRWVTALVVDNPHSESVALRLRYVSNRGTVHRRIVVGPRETQRFDDLAANLFGLPESIGALWVEYPQSASPVMFTETIDASRGGAPAVARPLDPGNAAGSGMPHDVLRVTAARGGEHRRVNLGFVNTGHGAARLRIRALAAGRAQTGNVLEWAIPEGDSWVLPDVAGRLSVTLDGTIAIETEVLEGRAVGYASIIDGLTGIQEILPAFPASSR